MKIKNVVILLVALLALVAACTPPDNFGSIRISLISGGQTRSIVPDVNLAPSLYFITATGPASEKIQQNTTEDELVISQALAGSWTIEVQAYNDQNVLVGVGAQLVEVDFNKEATVMVIVRPVGGQGDLELEVVWDAESLTDTAGNSVTPVIEARLVPVQGNEVILNFVHRQAGFADCSRENLSSGFYTLSVQLKYNDELITGLVESVLIFKDEITSERLDFQYIQDYLGKIRVNIQLAIISPLDVTLVGQEAMLPLGTEMTVRAITTSVVENVEYIWYLNGDLSAIGTGKEITITGDTEGSFSLSVQAFSADGLQAGSATCQYRVEKIATPTPTPVVTATPTPTPTPTPAPATLYLVSNGNGIVSPDLPVLIPYGNTYSITATANSCYRFVRWEVAQGSGVVMGNATSSVTSVRLNAGNATLRAIFEAVPYTLDIQSAAQGTVSPAGIQTRISGSPLTISATVVANGYVFDHWVVAGGICNIADIYSATTTATLNCSNATIRATYSLRPYTLTVQAGANGSVNPAGQVTVTHGAAQTIIATPAANYNFVNWTVISGSGISFANASAATTSVILTGGNATIRANFVQRTWSVTIYFRQQAFFNSSTYNNAGSTTATVNDNVWTQVPAITPTRTTGSARWVLNSVTTLSGAIDIDNRGTGGVWIRATTAGSVQADYRCG